MKTKFTKILGVALTTVLLVSMMMFAAPTPVAAQAPTPNNTWAPFGTPQVGPAFGFKIDPNITGLGPMVKAINGDLYVFATYAVAPANRLFKSVDGGRSWVDLPNYFVQVAGGVVVDFAASDLDANTLYVLNAGAIFKTIDGGNNWAALTIPLGSAALTCIDVGYSGTDPFVFVGTATPVGVPGDTAWSLDEVTWGEEWEPLGINLAFAPTFDGIATYEIACSPNFSTDGVLFAVVLRDVDTSGTITVGDTVGVWYKYGASAWNGAGAPVGSPAALYALTAANDIPDTKPCMAFVDDFSSNPAGVSLEYWVSIDNTVQTSAVLGGLYGVYFAGAPLVLQAGTNFTSVDVDGNAYAAAIVGGTTAGAIWRSLDDGFTVASTAAVGGKGPTVGLATGTLTYVLLDEDYINNGNALALVNGAAATDSAGLARQVADRCWNQISLIDTNIGIINDVAFSDGFATDKTAFLSTRSLVGVADSLWKTDGTNWERVAAAAVAAGIRDVQTSPFYSTDQAVYYLNTARTALTRSANGSNSWAVLNNQPLGAIAGWTVMDSTKVIAGRGANASVNITLNRGQSAWIPYTTGLAGFIQAFALAPDFAYGTVGHILAGNSADAMFLSADFGKTWTQQGGGAPIAVPGAGTIYPAFADTYNSNAGGPTNVIYATSSLGGVYTTFANGPPFTRIDNVTGAPTTGATAVVAADSFNLTVAAASACTISVPNGAIQVTSITDVGADNTVAYNVGTATYTLTFVGAEAGVFRVTVLSGPVTGTIANTGAANIAVAAFSDVDADMVLPATPLLPATGGTFSAPDAATTAAVANPFAVSASSGIVVADGVVYAVDVAAGEGMSRCLNPTASVLGPLPLRPYFERQNTWINGTFANNTLGAGIPNGQGLQKISGSTTVFAIDNSGAGIGFAGVFQYIEGLVTGPALTGPADGVNIGNEDTVLLSWADLAGALNYTVQYDTVASFNASPLTVAPTVASQRITGLVSGTTYYWRVRVTEQLPCRTNWSAAQSFITSMSAAAWNPGVTPGGFAPAAGATGVSLTPAFQWNPASGATGYAFVLSASADLSSPIIDTTVTSPVYLCTTALSNATTYYWQVTAIGTVSASFQFNGTFTTLAAPAAPVFTCGYCGLQYSSQAALEAHITATHGPVEAGTPLYIWFVIAIGAVLVVAVVVLIARTRTP